MRTLWTTILCLALTLGALTRPAAGQFFSPTDAAVISKLGEILRTHRQNLIEAIRTTRGVEKTFHTLRNLEDYERSLRRDLNFMSSLDLTRLDELERIILYSDQTEFYFRGLTAKINRDMYNIGEMGRYGDGFVGAMDGLGVVDENMIRGLFSDDKTLAELGVTPEQSAALLKELNVESTLLDLYEVKGAENLINALTEQGAYLKQVAQDSSVKLDQGQRVMLLAKSEESLIEALKYQQQLADKLKERNQKITRTLMLKSQMEADIQKLQEFSQWHSSQEHNLGFFDSEFVKRYRYKL